MLDDVQDADDLQNFAADDVSGFNVNAIAIEVPITMLTSDGFNCTQPTTSKPPSAPGERPRGRGRKSSEVPGKDPLLS
ncbi:MAG: hypothetical protein R3F37_05580 [Candidatus Competibacteraceae bacterium]